MRRITCQDEQTPSLNARDEFSEQRIAACKAGVNQITGMLRSTPQNWRSYIDLARLIITHIDTTGLMNDGTRSKEQICLISGLQRLAYADADNGGISDIAAWCSRQWVTINQRHPHDVAVLRGIGQGWLARAQPALTRIHRVDGSSSSSGGSSTRSNPSLSASEEQRQAATSLAEAERRTGTAAYVEARGYLQPAVEYFERAITETPAQQASSGDLLALTAEAYMSLGNASSPRINEQYFHRAIRLLRAANAIQGYSLSPYLQHYLDDYGRLVD